MSFRDPQDDFREIQPAMLAAADQFQALIRDDSEAFEALVAIGHTFRDSFEVLRARGIGYDQAYGCASGMLLAAIDDIWRVQRS